jgi:hypothetical protein
VRRALSPAAGLFTALAALAALVASPASADERSPHVVAGEAAGTLHLRLDASATYGIGGQSFLGGLAHLSLGVSAWDSGDATGSLDVGLALAYHHEPTWLAPWLSGESVQGAGHRAQTLLVAGHTFHMLPGRELSLGMHVYAGWNRWVSSYSLEYAAEGVRGQSTLERDHLVTGGQLTLAGRISDRVGLNLVAGGPFPTMSSYVVGMFHVGVGLTVHIL